MPQTEQVTFTDPDNNVVALIINPETLSLTWKKVINRIRTKTRLVTMFWGEEPVKFSYAGQTGYAYPTFSEQNTALDSINSATSNQIKGLQNLIDSYEKELTMGGPYSFGSAKGNMDSITVLQKNLSDLGASLVPRTALLGNLNKQLTNTQILYLSTRFKLLKQLELMYRRHQNPSDQLVQINYRDYIFNGYFESFSYTDDAKNPWNWMYVIDFTILNWAWNYSVQTGEILLDGQAALLPTNSFAAKNLDYSNLSFIDYTTDPRFSID